MLNLSTLLAFPRDLFLLLLLRCLLVYIIRTSLTVYVTGMYVLSYSHPYRYSSGVP